MDIIKTYGNIIKNNILKGKPVLARKQIILGLKLESFRVKHFSDKNTPEAYKYLSRVALKSIYEGLEHPEKCAWTNIFAPVEILQYFGFNCISIEAVSTMLSGFKNADVFIDKAENEGIAPTLCSFHKNFIGTVLSDVVPAPVFATTTSMICDGNINTFHTLSKKKNIPHYILDIPDSETPDSVQYVVDQLKEMIEQLEEITGKKFDYEELKNTIVRENESKIFYKEFIKAQKNKYYPNTLTLNLYTLFASHLQIGTKEIHKFYELLKDEIKTYPEITGKKIFWVHLLPYYQETLKSYFNFNEKYYIQGYDLNLDYMEELDIQNPLEALAKKMINNVYNGPYERKAKLVSDMVKELGSDGVIHFCHWGCKQASGGSMLLKEELKKINVPVLNLDGDALDRRNSHDGQIKTRLEAFIELIENKSTPTGGTE